MPQSVKISDELYEQLKADAALEIRSLGEQAELYFRLGRAIARSPDFSQAHVDGAIAGELPVESLTLEEQEMYFSTFEHLLNRPGPSAQFYEERRLRGVGVGEDSSGKLIRQLPGGETAAYN